MANISVLHGQSSKLAIMAGKYKMTNSAFEWSIGGTMKATAAGTNSALITFAPPFVSAPIIIASVMSGLGANTANIANVVITGVTVSNCYVTLGAAPISACTVGMVVIGECRL